MPNAMYIQSLVQRVRLAQAQVDPCILSDVVAEIYEVEGPLFAVCSAAANRIIRPDLLSVISLPVDHINQVRLIALLRVLSDEIAA